MVKILLFADTHLGFDHPVRKVSNRPRRGEDFFHNFQLILDYAMHNEVDLLLHGGDFFYRSKVPAAIVTKAYEMLFNFAEKGIPTVIVPGNHERSALPDSILTRHPNIHIFTRARKYHFALKGINLDLYGFPFIRKDIDQTFPTIVKEFADTIDSNAYNILCLHQAIEGSSVGPADFTFKPGPDVISFKDIPDRFNLIFSGHIHRRQILWKESVSRKIPIVYPGSIERTSFAEKTEVKGFYLLEITKDSESTIKSFLRFKTLPTRDMVDLVIPENIHSLEEFKYWLRAKVMLLKNNSIIRFRNIRSDQNRFLTRQNLRSMLPEEMIVQYNYRKKSAIKNNLVK